MYFLDIVIYMFFLILSLSQSAFLSLREREKGGAVIYVENLPLPLADQTSIDLELVISTKCAKDMQAGK